MKIYNISSSINSSKNLKKDKNINKTSFCGGVQYNLKKPPMLTKHCDALYGELSKLLNNKLLQGREMLAPKLLNIDGVCYGVTWNLKNPNIRKLEIRDKIVTRNDWNQKLPGQTILTANFDNRGLIQSGSLIKINENGYNQTALFERESSTGKRLYFEGMTMRRSRGYDDIWSSLPEYSCYSLSRDMNPKESYKDVKLADLFFELLKKNHAML